MSEYHNVQIEVDDKDSIVKSLEEMGYKPKVFEEAQNLLGYRGDRRKQVAHIIIPKSQVGRASNDIGFEKQENGKYLLHISEYDIGQKFFDQTNFKKLYNKYKVERKLNASSRFKIVGKRIDEKGNIKLRVARR